MHKDDYRIQVEPIKRLNNMMQYCISLYKNNELVSASILEQDEYELFKRQMNIKQLIAA